MKTAKLVLGIISIVLFGIILFQSCVAGAYNIAEENGESGGTAGLILSICMLVAGIVGIATRKNVAGGIVSGCFYLFGGLIGLVNAGSYGDLVIWAFVCFAFAAVFIVGSIVTGNAKKKAAKATATEKPATEGTTGTDGTSGV